MAHTRRASSSGFRPVGRVWGTLLVVLAVAMSLAPIPRELVENLYSQRLYSWFQPVLTSASNLVPFALLDLLIISVVILWLVRLGSDVSRHRRGQRGRLVAGVVGRTAVWGAVLYLAFLLLWGLNYRRVPLASRVPFDETAISTEKVRTLAFQSADRLNVLYPEARVLDENHRDDIGALRAAFATVQRDLGSHRLAEPGRSKRTLLDLYFRRAGVDGMTDPYFLETLMSSDLLPVERPFVTAHEWSHLAAFADEGEANFVGWLTCIRSDVADQYSAWLFLFSQVSRAIAPRDRPAVYERLEPGPRADLTAIAARLERSISPSVSAIGWRAYDRYLKANRVDSGVASYSEVIRLVLGARITPSSH